MPIIRAACATVRPIWSRLLQVACKVISKLLAPPLKAEFRAPVLSGQQGVIPVNKNRPVNLDISTIQLPAAALVSILHRISGVVLFAVVGLLLWMLDKSLKSAQGFAEVAAAFNSVPAKLILWAALAALIYHLVAGIRHLLMDLGVGESLEGGRRSAVLVLVIAAILILLAGVCIW